MSIYLAYLLRSEAIQVKGSLDRIRDLVHVDDVVDAWRLALESTASGVFNIGTGVGTTIRELIAELVEACGLDTDYPIDEVGGTPGDQFAITADISAIGEALGWKPRIDLAAGLRDTVSPHFAAGRV